MDEIYKAAKIKDLQVKLIYEIETDWLRRDDFVPNGDSPFWKYIFMLGHITFLSS